MRLNLFLPFRRRAESGAIRRVLRAIGPSWCCSPVRRLVQAACFVIFLGLFFYVCWPYTARPAGNWYEWQPTGLDAKTGRVTMIGQTSPAEPFRRDMVLHVVDTNLAGTPYLGAFRVAGVADGQLRLEPAERSGPQQFTKVLAAFGPWSLTRPGRAWKGWLPVEVDAQTYRVTLAADEPPAEPIAPETALYLVDDGTEQPHALGWFKVARVDEKELRLEPFERPDSELADRLLTSFGPWSLHEAEPGGRIRVGHDWRLSEADPDTGQLSVVTDHPPEEAISRQLPLHLANENARGRLDLGPLKVTRAAGKELRLEPAERTDLQLTEKLLSGLGPWSLHEAEPGVPASHYADDLLTKELLAAEAFLAVDPLVSVSTALAAKTWVWSLWCVGVLLLVCLVIPRGFCGWVCPMGTLVDLFDWALGRRIKWFRVVADGWWVHVKYYLLLAVLIASLFGVLLSGFVAAIPVLTRGLAFLVTPLQTAGERGWHQMPPVGAGHWVSIGLLCVVLGLGLLRPRFWCKYVCPTGAVFSIGNLLRLTDRKVESSCTGCNQCVKICPFDAIKPDFTTRATDCTFCQTCGGICPVGAIGFVGRWDTEDRKTAGDPPTGETPIGRRGFLSAAVGITAGTAGGIGGSVAIRRTGARLEGPDAPLPVRPPGSVPEREFLQMCVRCGECFQACPNDVLQPLGFRQGLEGLWTPQVVADWSGCEPSCNNCGQVCPTGAIRALPLEEKRVARMGLAVVNRKTCLPYAGREPCQLCVDDCTAAGYDAIEFIRVGGQLDPDGNPIEGTGMLAPVVLSEACVGCGLCQTRCLAINATEKGLLRETAIRIEAGPAKEDRLMTGSYLDLRKEEQRKREQQRRRILEKTGGGNYYVPESLK